MITAHGQTYGDLIADLLPMLDPPNGEEIRRWTIRKIEQERLDPDDHRRAHVCVSFRYHPTDVPPSQRRRSETRQTP